MEKETKIFSLSNDELYAIKGGNTGEPLEGDENLNKEPIEPEGGGTTGQGALHGGLGSIRP